MDLRDCRQQKEACVGRCPLLISDIDGEHAPALPTCVGPLVRSLDPEALTKNIRDDKSSDCSDGPDGKVYGITNQSLAKTRANSMNRSFARSVVLASISPKLVFLSSNDHHRVFGIPAKARESDPPA